MKPIIYEFEEFDHRDAKLKFDYLKEVVEKYVSLNNLPQILLGNHSFNGIQTDAMVITADTIIIFVFKNYKGTIVPALKGKWKTEDGKIIEGGYGRISPYHQAYYLKVQAEKWIHKILSKMIVRICLTFDEDATISPSNMDCVSNWLDIISISDISNYLSSQLSSANNGDINKIEDILNLKRPYHELQDKLIPIETVSEYYDELANIPENLPIRNKYAILNKVLNHVIDQKTREISLKFTGPFSKIQYLIREYGIDKSLALAINDTRVRLRSLAQKEESELVSCYFIDLKTLCKFISNIYEDAQIPEILSRLFPVETEKYTRKRLKDAFGTIIDYVRCVVNEWDDSYIYATVERTGEDIKIDYTTKQKYNLSEEWSYIGKLIEEGSILNLVKPRIENEIIYPELIILNPDYLVNVTVIASCFEEFGESYKMNLIHKISPNANTVPILLGNFAGQLLDETSFHKEQSYNDSMKHFFRKNALSFACCKDSLIGFHVDAQKQKSIIERVISQEHRIHQKDGKPISSEELILEPTYFCEPLGLQGRLDFIHFNNRTIIEQKSGKAKWPDNPDAITQQTKHYIQLLLYRAIFHYAYKKIDYNKLAAWLFYSKYENGLLEIGSAPKLLFQAFKIRNLIVWSDMLCAKNGMNSFLDSLTADKIFPNTVDGRFCKWVKPRINKLLSQISNASDLERAYYYRFMRFIANEHMLSKVGNKEKEDEGVSSLWNSSLLDRKEAGNIYDHLDMKLETEDKEVELIKFYFRETVDQDVSNFRVGDIVVFYPYDYNSEPIVTSNIVFRGTITQIKSKYVEVKLRYPQHRRIFSYFREDSKCLSWAIEHDFMESSYSSLYRGMQTFLCANQDRRDLILGQRKPVIDTSIQLVGDYNSPEFNDMVLRTKQAQDIYIIVGPPGTGKTSYGMLNVLQEHLTDPGVSVLLMAYTNRAVDEICSKLVENKLDFIRLGSELGCSEEYRKYLFDNKVANMENIKVGDVKNLICQTRIICGTTTALNSKIEIFNLKKFDLAIIDEASQILEPFVLGLLSVPHEENGKKENAIAKFVLIGDEKQLPAVVQQSANESAVNEPLLNKIGLTDCRLSLFERFEKLLGKDDERYCHVLTKQGRMHSEIAKFPNYTFYQNTLKIVPLEHQLQKTPTVGLGRNGIEDLLLTRRVAFLSCRPSRAINANETDKVNSAEAKIIAATVIQGYEMIKDNFDVNKSIGVIVPYRNQISAIRNMIDNMSKAKGITCLHDITIDTVERYQGSQRDLIIYGFTAKKNYQLNFLTSNEYFDENEGAIIDRKLNVAMTRAKKNLVMVGNDSLLVQDITFYKLIEYCKSIQSFLQIEPNTYVTGNFSIPKIEFLDNSAFVNSVFTTDTKFQRAYDKLVMEPIKKATKTIWPNIILGNEMDVNMSIIGYGRIEFSNQLSLFSTEQGNMMAVSPQEQVLLYAYYIMRQHYCSYKAILTSFRTFFEKEFMACKKRIHYIDIGCGPSTCISALLNTIDDIEHIDYVGVDISTAMKKLGNDMLREQAFNNMNVRFMTSFNELSDEYWENKSQISSLFIFNFSYFFSNVKSDFTEKLALRIVHIMNKYSLNRYLFIIQHSKTDSKNFMSYKVFKKIVLDKPNAIKILKSGEDYFSYQLNGNSKSLNFCFEIWKSN